MKHLKKFETVENSAEMSYDEAFECLYGLSIGHVRFKNFGEPRISVYVKDNKDLQNRINSIKRYEASTIEISIGDGDDGLLKDVTTLFFDTKTKVLLQISGVDREYGFVQGLHGKKLNYSTFKQVMRTDWDWEWKGEVRKFNKLKNFLGFK